VGTPLGYLALLGGTLLVEALVAVGILGMPLEEVARRMGTNRNALYKLLHDARQRLKHKLEAEGLSPEEILAAFGSEPG